MAEKKFRVRDRVYCEYGFGHVRSYAARRGSREPRYNIQLETGGFGAVCELNASKCILAEGDDVETVTRFCAREN